MPKPKLIETWEAIKIMQTEKGSICESCQGYRYTFKRGNFLGIENEISYPESLHPSEISGKWKIIKRGKK